MWQKTLPHTVITKVITIAESHMTFTHLALYTPRLIDITWLCHYIVFLTPVPAHEWTGFNFKELNWIPLWKPVICCGGCWQHFYVFLFVPAPDPSTKRTEGKKVSWLGVKCNLAATPALVIWLPILYILCLFPVFLLLILFSSYFTCTIFVFSLSLSTSTSLLLSLSSPLASAVLLYLRHSGIKLRDSKVFPGLSTEKEKWLTFLKTKKVRLGNVFPCPKKKTNESCFCYYNNFVCCYDETTLAQIKF